MGRLFALERAMLYNIDSEQRREKNEMSILPQKV